MRLVYKLLLFMLACSVLPISLVGFLLLRNAERELKTRIAAQQATIARSEAELIGRDVADLVEALARATERFDFGALTPGERTGALSLLYHQSAVVAGVALLDASGQEAASPVHRDAGEPGLRDHPPLSAAEFAQARQKIPAGLLESAPPGSVALLPAHARASWGCAAATLLVRAPGGDRPLAVAIEISLCPAQARARAAASPGAGELFVLDGDGRLVAGPRPDAILTSAPAEDRAFVAAGQRSGRYELGAQTVVAAAEPVSGRLGWTVLVRVPESAAFATVARMRRTVLASLSAALGLLFVLGYLFMRRVDTALSGVVAGAEAYGRGRLDVRVPVTGQDELADLAKTFNAMGGELLTARSRLERWNEDLKQKVEERTAELKKAQAQLVEAQKLAAIGQLGAGVAHEINNPLAGILGHAQLLLLDRDETDKDTPALKSIESAARRAREITHNLLRFSQQRDRPDLKAIDLNGVVRDTLVLTESSIRSEGIELRLALSGELPAVHGDAGQLSQVLLNLVTNARTALRERTPRRLELSTAAQDGRVRLSVEDTGKGIKPEHLPRVFEPFFTTKDVWTNVGLGLSVSYRIIAEHGGQIRVTSQVGKGSRFVVELPAAGAGGAPLAPASVGPAGDGPTQA